jgi:hypothetical protein
MAHRITDAFSPTPAADEAATTVDPTPAGVPDAGDASRTASTLGPAPAGSDAAGSGRPTSTPDGVTIGRDGRPRYHGRRISQARILELAHDRRLVELVELEFAAERAAIDYEAERFKTEQRNKLAAAATLVAVGAFELEAERLAVTAAVYGGLLDYAGRLIRQMPGGDGR